MKAYFAKFQKKDGSVRGMYFVRLADLPASFLGTRIKGTGRKDVSSSDRELVWDIEKKDFRFFIPSSVVGEVLTFEVDEKEIS